MPVSLPLDREALAALCRRHHIRRLSLFGSVLEGTARPDSDVDLLVELSRARSPAYLAWQGSRWSCLSSSAGAEWTFARLKT